MIAVQVLVGRLVPPLAGFGLIYIALGIALARRRSRWLLVLTIVLALAHLLSSIPFFTAVLAHPESPGSFLPDAFVGLTGLVVLLGAAAGLRGARPDSRRPTAIGAGVLAALAVVVSIVAAWGVETAERQTGDIPVEILRSQFPERLHIPAGGAVL